MRLRLWYSECILDSRCMCELSRSRPSHLQGTMRFLAVLLVVLHLLFLLLVNQVESCETPALVQSQQKTIHWSSGNPQSSGRSWRTFLFAPPETFREWWASADFALIKATLSIPYCDGRTYESLNPTPVIALLPEVWIPLLLTDNPNNSIINSNDSKADDEDLCIRLFGSGNLDQVPGCQNWSRLEAWRRLRIFFDITFPIRVPLDGVVGSSKGLLLSRSNFSTEVTRICGSGSNSSLIWRVDVTSVIQQWMLERPPWVRSNATLPILLIETLKEIWNPTETGTSQPAELHLTYTTDSKQLI